MITLLTTTGTPSSDLVIDRMVLLPSFEKYRASEASYQPTSFTIDIEVDGETYSQTFNDLVAASDNDLITEQVIAAMNTMGSPLEFIHRNEGVDISRKSDRFGVKYPSSTGFTLTIEKWRGSFAHVIYVYDEQGFDTSGSVSLSYANSFLIDVPSNSGFPSISSLAPQTNEVGDTVNIPLTLIDPNSGGGSATFQSDNLPDGLSISGTSITGTITSAGGSVDPVTVQIRAVDSLGLTYTMSFDWTIPLLDTRVHMRWIEDDTDPTILYPRDYAGSSLTLGGFHDLGLIVTAAEAAVSSRLQLWIDNANSVVIANDLPIRFGISSPDQIADANITSFYIEFRDEATFNPWVLEIFDQDFNYWAWDKDAYTGDVQSKASYDYHSVENL